MKYVMIRRGLYRMPVVFPDQVEHSAFQELRPVSAGFCHQPPGSREVYATGKSASLKLAPMPGDSEILTELFSGTEALIYMVQDQLDQPASPKNVELSP